MNKIYFIFLFLIPIICDAQIPTLNQGNVKSIGYFSEIPYENVRDKIIVSAVIGQKTYRFILDTGAPTTITKSLFEELNLPVLNKLPVIDANGQQDSLLITSLNDISLGEVVFKNTPVLIAKDAFIFDCHKVDGFIGSNLLRNSIVRISYKDLKITLTDMVERLALNKKQSTDLVLNTVQSSPYIDVRVKGRKLATARVLFDSGMEGLYDVSLKHYALFKAHNIFVEEGEGMGSGGLSLNGNGSDTTQYRLRLPELNINGAILTNVSAQTTASDNSRIGAELLHYGVITLDYKNKKFYFDPYEARKDLTKDLMPVSVTVKDKKLVVAIIWDENLKDKIAINDRILAVDEKDYTSFNPCDFVVGNSIFEKKNKVMVTIENSKGVVSKVELIRGYLRN